MPGFRTIHLPFKSIQVHLLAVLLMSSFLVMAGTSQTYSGAGQISSNDANPNNNSASEGTTVPPLGEITVPPLGEITVASYPLTSLYDKLLDIGTSGNIIPELVTAWTVGPLGRGGIPYTFTLRQNVLFHDGTPVNASAVKFNMEETVEMFTDLTRTSLLDKRIVSLVRVLDEFAIQVMAGPGLLQTLTGLDAMMVSPPHRSFYISE